jgi:hypothetical protein
MYGYNHGSDLSCTSQEGSLCSESRLGSAGLSFKRRGEHDSVAPIACGDAKATAFPWTRQLQSGEAAYKIAL